MFQDTPLADACLKNDFQSLRALLFDELAAKSIFIKGTSQDSLICTLPYSRKPSSSIVQYREIIPVEEKDEHFIEEIDQALSNFLSHLSNTDGIETTGKYRFHVGDLVKLLRGKRCSSELSSHLCLVEQSEKCLGDSSWGKVGQVVMLNKEDKFHHRLLARVLELTSGAACDYDISDLTFADDTFLTDQIPTPRSIVGVDEVSDSQLDSKGAKLKLLPRHLTASSDVIGRGPGNLIDGDLSTFWKSRDSTTVTDSVESSAWVQIQVPNEDFKSLEMFAVDHGVNTASTMDIHAGPSDTALKLIKSFTVPKPASQWITLLTDDEVAEQNIRGVKVIKLANIAAAVTGGKASDCHITAIQVFCHPQLPTPLMVGERVELSDSYSATGGNGWCLGRPAVAASTESQAPQVGIVLCAHPPVKGAEQRGIVVVNEATSEVGVFRASWLQRVKACTDFQVGDRVQLNPSTWRAGSPRVAGKCLGCPEDYLCGVVQAVGEMCHGVRRNIELETLLHDDDDDKEDDSEVESLPPPPPPQQKQARSSLYAATTLQPANRPFVLLSGDRSLLAGVLAEVTPMKLNFELLIERFGLQIWSKVFSEPEDVRTAVDGYLRWSSASQAKGWSSNKPGKHKTVDHQPSPAFKLLSTPAAVAAAAATVATAGGTEGGDGSSQVDTSTKKKWNCKACFAKNSATAKKCKMCGEKKPVAEAGGGKSSLDAPKHHFEPIILSTDNVQVSSNSELVKYLLVPQEATWESEKEGTQPETVTVTVPEGFKLCDLQVLVKDLADRSPKDIVVKVTSFDSVVPAVTPTSETHVVLESTTAASIPVPDDDSSTTTPAGEAETAAASAAAAKAEKERHLGEFRSGKRYCCALPADDVSSEDGSKVCVHGGKIIRADHWSCCGNTSNDTKVCVVQPTSAARVGSRTVGITVLERWDRSISNSALEYSDGDATAKRPGGASSFPASLIPIASNGSSFSLTAALTAAPRGRALMSFGIACQGFPNYYGDGFGGTPGSWGLLNTRNGGCSSYVIDFSGSVKATHSYISSFREMKEGDVFCLRYERELGRAWLFVNTSELVQEFTIHEPGETPDLVVGATYCNDHVLKITPTPPPSYPGESPCRNGLVASTILKSLPDGPAQWVSLLTGEEILASYPAEVAIEIRSTHKKGGGSSKKALAGLRAFGLKQRFTDYFCPACGMANQCNWLACLSCKAPRPFICDELDSHGSIDEGSDDYTSSLQFGNERVADPTWKEYNTEKKAWKSLPHEIFQQLETTFVTTATGLTLEDSTFEKIHHGETVKRQYCHPAAVYDFDKMVMTATEAGITSKIRREAGPPVAAVLQQWQVQQQKKKDAAWVDFEHGENEQIWLAKAAGRSFTTLYRGESNHAFRVELIDGATRLVNTSNLASQKMRVKSGTSDHAARIDNVEAKQTEVAIVTHHPLRLAPLSPLPFRDSFSTELTSTSLEDERQRLVWNIQLQNERIRISETATPPAADGDNEEGEEEDNEEEESYPEGKEAELNGEFQLLRLASPTKLRSKVVNRRASMQKQASLVHWSHVGSASDYKPLEHIFELVSFKDNVGNTAAHHAAFVGLNKSVRALWSYGAPKWTANALGETPAGLAAGVRGDARLFQLHKACRRHNLIDDHLWAAALHTPADYAAPKAFEPTLEAISAGSFVAALNKVLSLQEKLTSAEDERSEQTEEAKHCNAYAALCMLLNSYSASAVHYTLHDEYASLLSPDSQLDPVYFYIRYLMWKKGQKPSKDERILAGDALAALRTFPDICSRWQWLTPSDNLDHVLEAERAQHSEEDEAAAAEEEEVDSDEEEVAKLPHDAPQNRWKRAKQGGAVSTAMDAIMALTGLDQVKLRAMELYSKVELQKTNPSDLVTDVTNNYLFVGNPGCGKTTVARLFSKLMVEIGYRTKPDIYEDTASDILKQKDPQGYFEANVDNAIGGVVFVDEAYLLHTAGSKGPNPVLDYLMKVTETERLTTSFILAGYDDEIKHLLTYNDGFPSRFNITVLFEDFSEQQIKRVLKSEIKRRGFAVESRKESGCASICMAAARRIGSGRNQKGFGNARTVRSFVDSVITRQQFRLDQLKSEGVDVTGERTRRTLCRVDVLGNRPDLQTSVAFKKLNELIGLESVKESVAALMVLQQNNYDKEMKNLAVDRISLHRVFLGNPGTGKTETARLYGALLKDFGFLSDGGFLETNGPAILGDHVGGTGAIVKDLMKKAKGKVLFIDEAYALDPKKAMYGADALDVMVSEMTAAGANDMAIILAGYEAEIVSMFRNGNPGLGSRFKMTEALRFEDFSDDELMKILVSMGNSKGYFFNPLTGKEVVRLVARERGLVGFANARSVATILERAITRRGTRIHQLQQSRAMAQARGERVPPPPNDSMLVLADFVTDELSAEKARDLFADIANAKEIHDFISLLEDHLSVSKSEGKATDAMMADLNFIFTGPPGTGKTTVARKFGTMLHNLEMLAKTNVVEVTGRSLCAEFVGQTSPKVDEAMKTALGGVPFIDEAYGLAGSSFGKEAVDAIVANLTMPTYRGKMVVIMAGYQKDIDMLFKLNEGLRSRFPRSLAFSSWNGAQASDALIRYIEKNGKTVSDASGPANAKLREYMEELTTLPGWASARDVYNNVYKSLTESRSSRIARVQRERNAQRAAEATTAGGGMAGKQKAEFDADLLASGYEMDDIAAAFDTLISERKRLVGLEDPREQLIRALGGGPRQEPAAAPAPKKNFFKKKEKQKEAEAPPPDVVNPDGPSEPDDPDDKELLAALEEACAELKKTPEEMRDFLTAGKIPDDIILLVMDKTKKSKQMVNKKLKKQIPKLLGRVTELIIQMEVQRSADEEEQNRRIQEAIRELQRQGKLEKCPAGYEWLRQPDGAYQCAGGSHFCDAEQIKQFLSAN